MARSIFPTNKLHLRDMKTYQHTQWANTILAFLIPSFLGLAIGSIFFHALILVAIIIGVTCWIFRSMTIEISNSELVWYFGSGLPRKSASLSEVVSAETIRTSFLNGWGIHYTPRGWLYNVSGFDAVAIKLRNGKQFCLGTDEPEKLAAELKGR